MAKGQVLIEAAIGLILMLLVLSMLHQHLLPVAQDNESNLRAQRTAIWARTADPEQTQLSSDYPSAKASGSVLSTLNSLVELDFETNNLRLSLADKPDSKNVGYRMARITDSWSAASAEKLESRPGLFVLNSLLSNSLVTTVQDVLSWLPVARELRSDSLIFGHVDADVVPDKAVKKIPNR